MIALVRVELARAMSRRLVRVLIVLAVVAIGVAGVRVFFGTARFDDAAQARARVQLSVDLAGCIAENVPASECRREVTIDRYDKSLPVTDLWPSEGSDPILAVPIVMLVFGAFAAAASVVGAEWRAGTVGTLLTWEPRRIRVGIVRIAVAAVAAMVIALALLVLFVAALLPAMLAHGGTAGVDGAWWRDFLTGMGKGVALVGLAAAVGAAFALLTRSTAVAIVIAFVYLNFVEGAVRAWRPGLRPWLVGDNATQFLLGGRTEAIGSAAPIMTLLFYGLVLVAVATLAFRRRDVVTA